VPGIFLDRPIDSITPLELLDTLVPSATGRQPVLDVFRFAWFAVRTFAGFVLLVLTIYAALWVFVKIDSMATRNADPDAALRLVKAYNAQRIGAGPKAAGCTACRVRTTVARLAVWSVIESAPASRAAPPPS